MFGAKKGSTKNSRHNVLLLDIENSSVGVALAHLQQGGAPILFGEHRVHLSMPQTLRGASIAKQIERAVHSAFERISLMAAKLRSNGSTAQRGEFTGVNVFLSAPWGVPNLAANAPRFLSQMQTYIAGEVSAFAPDIPLNFYTTADASVHGSALRGQEGITLVVIVRGEITELILLGRERALGYGTLPIGSRSIYRTLQTHAGLTLAEVPAVLSLSHQPLNIYSEPLSAASRHMLEHVAPGLEALTHGGTPSGILVVAEQPIAEWFARMLEGDESLEALFTPEATIRTLSAHHAARHLGGHDARPDLHLSLGALFTDAKFNSLG